MCHFEVPNKINAFMNINLTMNIIYNIVFVLIPPSIPTVELAMIMDRLYGGVCYAGIDTDPELKYPKGAGRVAFSNQQSYIAAISARFVQLQHGDIDKRVSLFKSFHFCKKILYKILKVLVLIHSLAPNLFFPTIDILIPDFS